MAAAEPENPNINLECQLIWLHQSGVSMKLAEILVPPKRKGIWFKGRLDEEEVLKTSRYSRALSMVAIQYWADRDDEAAVRSLSEIRTALEEDLNQTTQKLDEAFQEFNLNERSNTTEEQIMSEDELQILRYLISANKLALKICRLSGDEAERAQVEQKASQLKTKMEAQKFKALVLSMKAEMFGILGDIDGRLVLLRKLVALEPNVLKYQIGLFQALRGIRREKSHLSEPSDEEIEAIVGAYGLDHESPTVLLNWTAHFYDIYKMVIAKPPTPTEPGTLPGIPEVPKKCHYYVFNGLFEDKSFKNFTLKMKEFAKKAVDKNPESVEAALREADIRWCDDQSLFDMETLVNEHLLKWKNSSSVFHRAGKFYCKHFGNNDRMMRKGLYYLEKSIIIDRRNFSAFLSYLRYNKEEYSKTMRTYQPLIEKINEYMIYYEDRKELASRLHFLKAVLLLLASTLCKNTVHEAVESWLTGFEGFKLTPNFWTDADIINQVFGRNIFPDGLRSWDLGELQFYLQNRIPVPGQLESRLKNLLEFLKIVRLELHNSIYSNPILSVFTQKRI